MTKGSIQPGIISGKVEVCPACGSNFANKISNPDGSKTRVERPFCPNHPGIHPTRYRVMFGQICQHHKSYETAVMSLNGLRHEHNSGTLDERDYQIKAKPLSFDRLAEEWLNLKAGQIKPASLRAIASGINKAQIAWGDVNIKSLKYSHFEDFFAAYPGAPKSKANALAALKQFWQWAVDRYGIPPAKKWPKLGYIEMAFRDTIDLSTQEAIINNIKTHEPLRVWLGVKWLATYIAIRPGEMRGLTEGQVDRQRGVLIIPHPKERRAKIIPLIEEDAEIIKNLPLAFDSSMPFFRHETTAGRARSGRMFSLKQFYNAWGRACKRLGVTGVTLYPGTKHSTAMGLRAIYTPEQIKAQTLHSTSAAFNRYFQTSGEDLRSLLEGRKSLVEPDNSLTMVNAGGRTSQVIEFSKNNWRRE